MTPRHRSARRLVHLALTGLLVVALAAPLHAQWVVIDVAHLVQAVLIAQRAQLQLETLRAQLDTIRRMARGLTGLDRYRLPALAITAPDAARGPYGRPWIEALARGDATGEGYRSTIVPLETPDALLEGLTGGARARLARQIATVEIADAVASAGGHQVGLVRAAHAQLQDAVTALERDVVSTASGAHDLTAVLDKVAVAELLARRQDLATNQVLAAALDQLLARSKRLRDTEALALNMQLVTWRDGPAVHATFAAGTGDALRTWRQP